jgi:hypothetical protein
MPEHPSSTSAKSIASNADKRTVQLIQRVHVISIGARFFWIGFGFAD